MVESGTTRTRAAVEALNRLEATGSHVLGATLTKSLESGGGYGYGRYGQRYGYGVGKVGKDKGNRTEILMIPQDSDSSESADRPQEADG